MGGFWCEFTKSLIVFLSCYHYDHHHRVQRPTRSTHSERSWLLGSLGQLQRHADQRSEDQGDGLLVLQISRFGTDHHWQQSNREGRPVQASWSHAVLGSVLECAYWLCLVQVQPAPVLILLHLRGSGVPAVDLLTIYKATARGLCSSMRYQSGTARCQNTCPRSWNRYSGGRCGSSLVKARTRTTCRLQAFPSCLSAACFSARPFTKKWISLTINSITYYQRRKNTNTLWDIQGVSLISQAARSVSETASCHEQCAYLTDL